MKPIAFISVFVALAVAQHWEPELVDSVAGNYRIKMGISRDGRVHTCYSVDTEHFHYAWYDTAWHREQFTANVSLSWNFAVSSSGRAGLLGVRYPAYDSFVLYERTEAGWISSIIPVLRGDSAYIAYDTFGEPSIAYRHFLGYDDYQDYARRTDSGWIDTTLIHVGFNAFTFGLTDFQVNASSNHAATICDIYYPHQIPHFVALAAVGNSTGGWDISVLASRVSDRVLPWSVAPRRDSGATVCYRTGPSRESLYCDWHFVTTSGVTSVALRVDSLDQEHIVYKTSDTLVYTWRTGATWAEEVAMDGGVAYFGGLILDQDDNPIVAYLDTFGRPWIARRVVGVAEGSAGAVHLAATATVVRGVLFLRTASNPKPQAASLLDISGRQVMALRAGANDVSGLAPGVYFVWEKRQASSPKLQAVRKVVITR